MLKVLPYEFSLVFRRLFRRRLQSSLMFGTFAVSICLSLLSWSLFHAIFLRNPDFDSDGALCVVQQRPAGVDFGIPSTKVQVEDWQENQTVFAEFAPLLLYNSSFLTHDDSTERVLSANLSTAALKMTGARPLLGRLFTPNEDKPSCAPVIMLSEATWRDRFAANPHIVGQIMKLDGVAATIVGVMPSSYRFPNNQQIWLPMGFLNPLSNDPTRTYDAIARLKPDVSIAQATEEMTRIQSHRADTSGVKVTPIVYPFRNYFLGRNVQLSAAVLFALSLLFVLVSCSNAANLVMIDFFGRRVEVATSTALGVPRWATVRHVCLQVFAVAAVAAGLSVVLLAFAAPHLHAALTQMNAPYWLEFSLEWHHAFAAFGLAVFSTAIAVVVPTAYLLLLSSDQLILNGAGGNRGSGRSRWGQLLLATQISLLTLLGVSAGMLIRSSYHLADNRLGFDPQPVFIGKMGMRAIDFPTVEARQATYRRIADEIARLPGVAAASVSDIAPGYPLTPNCYYAADPTQLVDGKFTGAARSFAGTEGFMTTLDIPLASGEPLVRTEKTDGPIFAVINQSLADRLWPNHDALGRALYVRYGVRPDAPLVTMIVRGIARDFRACGPLQQINDSIHTSFAQSKGFYSFLLARGQNGVPDMKAIQETVRRVDSRVALYFPDTLQHQIDLTVSPLRLTTRLTSLYAVAAALLCAVGIYSLTVAQVLQRSREFGIRMALGIEPQRLWVRFTRGYLITTACGVAVGLLAALPTVRFLQAFMYGMNPFDGVTFFGVAGSILAISALACIPSLFRLQRIHPADCLRSY